MIDAEAGTLENVVDLGVSQVRGCCYLENMKGKDIFGAQHFLE